MRKIASFAAVLVLVAWACRVHVDPGPGETCESDAECDDEIDCTVDFCDVDSRCGHRAVDELCPEGVSCVVDVGCGEAPCEGDEDCDDGIECTLDLCGVGGLCDRRPLDERCEPGETCTPGLGCEAPTGCSSDAECDDGIACTLDRCAVDNTCAHLGMNEECGENERCAVGAGCVPGECSEPTGLEDCDDGDFCNGVEQCEPEFGCVPAEAPRDCDDNEECTIDSCDSELNQCVYALNSEIPGCDDFDPSQHLSGCFSIDPPASQRCGWGSVNYTISEVCFSLVGPILTISAGPYSLSQDPAPSDASFSASAEVTGGCTEQYALSGTFTGSSAFSGSWTANFVNVDGFSCALGGCRALSIAVTGTRTSGP